MIASPAERRAARIADETARCVAAIGKHLRREPADAERLAALLTEAERDDLLTAARGRNACVLMAAILHQAQRHHADPTAWRDARDHAAVISHTSIVYHVDAVPCRQTPRQLTDPAPDLFDIDA